MLRTCIVRLRGAAEHQSVLYAAGAKPVSCISVNF